MAGDMDVVEDAIDWLPPRADPAEALDALDSLKRQLRLLDGWRNTFPDTRSYTYIQDASVSMS